MTTASEYGPVTPIRRPGLPLDSAIPPKPPYQDNAIPMPKPVPGSPSVPPRPLYPDNALPMPKPVPLPGVPPKPPYPVNPVPVPKPPVNGTPVTPKPPVVDPGTGPGTGRPPVTVPPGTQGQPPGTPGSLGLDFMRQVTPNELVANQLNNLLSSDSRYIQNARQRGREFAASRGNLNSSIGAGASERAAIEAGLPIAESDAGVYRQANQGNFESLNQLRQMRTAAELDNWLASENYTRDFNERLATLAIESGADMLTYITQRAMEDPAVWTPDVISGYNNFFNLNFRDMFGNFFSGPGGD